MLNQSRTLVVFGGALVSLVCRICNCVVCGFLVVLWVLIVFCCLSAMSLGGC